MGAVGGEGVWRAHNQFNGNVLYLLKLLLAHTPLTEQPLFASESKDSGSYIVSCTGCWFLSWRAGWSGHLS